MERRPSTVAEALAEWLDDLTFDRSPQTIATYRSLLKLPDLALDGLDRAYCRQWMTEQVRRRKPAGAQTACAALRSFCAWLVGRGWLALNPTDGTRAVRVPEPPAKALSARQVEALWQAAGELDGLAARCDTDGQHVHSTGLRSLNRVAIPDAYGRADSTTNRLLLSLLSAGLRRAEAAGLLWQDMDFERGTMTVFGKGRKYRRVLIPKAARELLAYMPADATTDASGAVVGRSACVSPRWLIPADPRRTVEFPGTITDGAFVRGHTRSGDGIGADGRIAEDSHRPDSTTHGSILNMNDDQVYAAFKKIARRAGVNCTPHQMRHTWATGYLRKGGSPLYLQQLGGWSATAMVQRYGRAALADAALDEARRLES